MRTLTRNEVRILRHLMTELAGSPLQAHEGKDAVYLFMHNGVSMSLNRHQAKLLAECRTIIAPDRERPGSLGPRAVSDLLHDAILGLLQQPATPAHQRARVSVDNLVARLKRAAQTWDVVLPVEGIVIGPAVKVGPVRFMKPETLARQKWTTTEARDWIRKEKTAAWAVLSVDAVDEEAARRLGEYQLQLVLDAINLYAGRLGGPRGAAAHLPGVRALRSITPFVRSHHSSSPAKHFVQRYETVGAWRINLKALHRFHGWRNVAALIAIDRSLTKAQERMLAALRWIGRGAASPWPEQAFLDFVVALESLLLGVTKMGGASYGLKLRCAYLLASRRDHRRTVFDAVSQLYRLRNDVVHSGSFEVTGHMRDTARIYATLALIRVLRDPAFAALNTEREIEAWFEKRFLPET